MGSAVEMPIAMEEPEPGATGPASRATVLVEVLNRNGRLVELCVGFRDGRRSGEAVLRIDPAAGTAVVLAGYADPHLRKVQPNL